MNPNKNYLGAGIMALAFFAAWGWMLPEYNKISELRLAIEDREELYSSRSAIIKKISDMNDEYQKKSADIGRISSVMPSKKSVAEALSALDKLSTQSGLQLSSANISGQPSEDPGKIYNSLPIEMSLVGSYPSLVTFLKSVEKNLRLIDISSIDAAAGTDNPNLLNFNIKGNAYYLK